MAAEAIESIRRALGTTAGGSNDILAPLATVYASRGSNRPRAIRDLAQSLNAGFETGQLYDLLQSGATLLNPYRYERQPNWPYGTHRSRRELIDEMVAAAAAGADSMTLARGAFLLATEQDAPYSLPTMFALLADQNVVFRAGWLAAQTDAVTAVLERERHRSGLFGTLVRSAADAVQAMIERADRIDDAELLRFSEAAERMSRLAIDRSDIQMRLANLLWRVSSLSRSRGRKDIADQTNAMAIRWSGEVGNAHFARWLQEAVHLPHADIRTIGFARRKRSTLDLRREP